MAKREEGREDKQQERGSMSVREAGRRGGEKVLEKRGREFYSEIGRKGGHARGEKAEEKRAKTEREAA